jgi:outer membrane lipopolysaccharide assembly protein LptE/RlpB
MKTLAATAILAGLALAGCGYHHSYRDRTEIRHVQEDFRRAGWEARQEFQRARRDLQRELRQAREDLRREMREAHRDFHGEFGRW